MSPNNVPNAALDTVDTFHHHSALLSHHPPPTPICFHPYPLECRRPVASPSLPEPSPRDRDVWASALRCRPSPAIQQVAPNRCSLSHGRHCHVPVSLNHSPRIAARCDPLPQASPGPALETAKPGSSCSHRGVQMPPRGLPLPSLGWDSVLVWPGPTGSPRRTCTCSVPDTLRRSPSTRTQTLFDLQGSGRSSSAHRGWRRRCAAEVSMAVPGTGLAHLPFSAPSSDLFDLSRRARMNVKT